MCVLFSLDSLEVLQAGAVVNRAFPLYKDTNFKKKVAGIFSDDG